MKENNNRISTEDDNLSFVKIIYEFWLARKTILKVTVIFAFLGIFVAVFSKNEFTASTTFVPVNQSKSGNSGLGGLASLAGINLQSGNSGAEISPELYPQIFKSIPFLLELLNTPLTIEGQKQPVTYKQFYKNIYNPGFLGNIKKYTLGLPSFMLSLFRSDVESDVISKRSSQKSELISLSLKDDNLIKKLRNQIKLVVNEKEGFVTVSAVLPEAIASAQLTLKAQKLLQNYILKFKTQKSTEQLKYLEARFLEKQNEFDSVKIEFARFQDQNSSINTSLGNIKLLQLQSDYDLAFTVYSELAKQVETQRLQVKQDTPLFTVLKPVTIPIGRSAPVRRLILGYYLFLGFVLSLGFVLAKRYLTDFKKNWILKNKAI